VVGGHLPLATGIALAEQYKETDNAVLCYFGDGSTNIGYFHESLNLAGVWNLPVVWIAENNQYGMGTAIDRASAVSQLIQKASAYGMEGKRVDGMDLIAVYENVCEALDRVRTGQGPQFLEMITYRFEGHSIGDPLRYRTKEEVEKWREDDPIGVLERLLLQNLAVSKDALEAIDLEVDNEIEEAVIFAEESPLPSIDELFTDIFVEA
jgi:pyruvate dehydrogenase E1 component alpha subunit